MARLGKTQKQQRQLSRWAEELRSRGFKLPISTSMPYEDLPDEGFLIQLCLNFQPIRDEEETGKVTTVKRYVDQELIEFCFAWFDHTGCVKDYRSTSFF